MISWYAIAAAIGSTTQSRLHVVHAAPVSGGCINQAWCVEGHDGARYFVKLNSAGKLPMFEAEQAGLAAIAATQTIRVPQPITSGTCSKHAFLVLEYLDLCSNGNEHLLGEQLAALHRIQARQFGFANPGTLMPRAFIETVVPPRRSWEKGAKCRTAEVGRIYGEFPTALLPREIRTPGPDRIRAVIVFCGNPVAALGDPARAVPAFEDLELLVCLDARMNETARLAHYVIATSQHFERHDLSIPGDALYPEAFAQYAPPVISKPPGTIHDWEFFWEISSRMKVPLTLKYWNYGLDYGAIPAGLALDMQRAPDPQDMIRFLCGPGDVSFEELCANAGGVRPRRPPSYVQAAPDACASSPTTS